MTTRPEKGICTCGHHMLYHSSWGNCLVEGCVCKGYVDGPAAWEQGEHPALRPRPAIFDPEHYPEDAEPLPNIPDDCDWRIVLRYVRMCAASWEGGARLLDNVRASDIVRAVDVALTTTGEGGFTFKRHCQMCDDVCDTANCPRCDGAARGEKP